MTDNKIEVIETFVNFVDRTDEEKNVILGDLYRDIHKLIENRMEEVSKEPINVDLFASILVHMALNLQIETFNYLKENGTAMPYLEGLAYKFYTESHDRIKHLFDAKLIVTH